LATRWKNDSSSFSYIVNAISCEWPVLVTENHIMIGRLNRLVVNRLLIKTMSEERRYVSFIF